VFAMKPKPTGVPCIVCRNMTGVEVKCDGLPLVICGLCLSDRFLVVEGIRRAKEAAGC
jgi:hypothetical protein